ncbi:MAG TPA: prephenate dehydrogenase [Euryarchaeota archaeon]|nr:prephenate dehydrogenase [Euryarchaeota archaeon]
MSSADRMPRIALIGGTGEFGRLFARLFNEAECSVVVTGRSIEKGEQAARSLDVGYTCNNTEAAAGADITIVSVSIENTTAVIEEVAPHIRPGCLLMDFTSVKVEPVQAMTVHAPEGAEVLGTHPMFGPRVTGLEGQIVIFTPVRGGRWTKFIEDFFKEHRARIFISTPEEHDRVMAVVQGLTHFAYITTASTIRKLGQDVEETRRYASPVYELMLDFIARIVGQNPGLYAQIQIHNPFVSRVHETFIKEAEALSKIVKNDDVDGFVKTMAESARIFKDVDSSMGKSDKAISALTHELKKLKSSVGKEVGVRHIYSGSVHIGTVVSVDPEAVVLENKGKRLKLKLSNVELLDDEAVLEWKKEHIGPRKMDFSFIFPEAVDETLLAEIIGNSLSTIVSSEVVDVFRGDQIPSGSKSITLRFETLNPGDDVFIERLLSGLGGKMR